MSLTVADRLRDCLAVLAPVSIQIEDESHLHAGHAGAREGSHLNLTIVAPGFAGQGMLARHRMIHAATGDLKTLGIHALRIVAKAPAEV